MRLSTALLLALVPAYAASMALKPRQSDSTVHFPTPHLFLHDGLTSQCAPSYTGKFQLAIGTDDETGTAMTMTDGQAVNQIPDGQPQAVSQIADGQPQASQIKDGQVQAPAVTQISDGQPQAPPTVSQISDGQPQAPSVTQISDGQPQGSKTKRQAACASGYLTLTLSNGTLLDQGGRFGYIAGGNNQFQFDNPVQAGGYGQFDFSICANGTIAWNGSTDWWKCDSGAGYYNLYNAEISPDACQPCKFLALACT